MDPTSALGACVILADQSVSSALQAARQLSSRGVRVFAVAPHGVAAVLRASRHCAEVLEQASDSAEAYCAAVDAWATPRTGYGQTIPIIPLSDRLAEFLLEGRSIFQDRFVVAIPQDDVTRRLLTKEHSLAIAEECGLMVPPWSAIGDLEEMEILSQCKFPIIVKPVSWSSKGGVSFKAEVFHSSAELHEFVAKIIGHDGRVIVQEYVQAPEDAFEFGLLWRSRDGSRSAVCTGHKMRQSTRTGGIMAWGIGSDIAEVRDLTRQFAEASEFWGVGGIEFINAGDVRWFVEFNPRPEAIHFLAEAAGMPLLWWLYQDLLGRAAPPSVSQGPAAAWVGSAWIQRLMRHPSDLRVLLTDAARFLALPKGTVSVWDPRDPKPALVLSGRILLAVARRMLQRARRPAR